MPRRDEHDDEYEDDDRPRRRRRDEDSDDEDDDPRPVRRRATSGGSGNTVVLALAGTVLGVFLICGGVALYVYRSVARGVDQVQQNMKSDMERMRVEQEQRKKDKEGSDKALAGKAVDQFLVEVKADRPEAAYQLTTADFRRRVSPDEFRKQIAGLADASVRWLEMRADFFAPDDGSTFVFDSSGGFGTTVKITAVREAGKWLIDRFGVTRGEWPPRQPGQ